MTDNLQTLSQRLAEGKIPFPEALRYATQMGDALRHMYDEGGAHGALTPETVILTNTGLRLLPALPGDLGRVTPYQAPERMHGHAPDSRADVFSFGAVVYEMLTGRPAFHGDTPDALAESVANSVPPPIGHEGLDHLVSTCLAKDRAKRWQSFKLVMMELKLLAVSERRSEPDLVLRHTQNEAVLRAEMQQLASEWSNRFEQQQEAIADLQRTGAEERSLLQEACEALRAVHAKLGEMDGRLAAALEQAARAQQTAAETRLEVAIQQTGMAEKLQGVEETVNAQVEAIERTHNSTAQTGDLVERVVEALESLQSLVLTESEARTAGYQPGPAPVAEPLVAVSVEG